MTQENDQKLSPVSGDSFGDKILEDLEPQAIAAKIEGFEENPEIEGLRGEHQEEEEDYNNDPPLPDPTTVAKVGRLTNSDGTFKTLIKARKSAFVHNLIYLDGDKFSFEGRDYLLPVYDRHDKQILLKTGRQVEKSTFLANNLVVTSAVKPYNKSLYVSPSHTQTRQFSNEKLRLSIEKSPLIRKYFQDHSISTQVFEKGFTNGSYIFLRSAFRSADRARGIAVSGVLAIDEIQDLLTSEIPVIMECISHYPNASVFMAGTPKSFDNPIEVYWEETTQNEWLVPCEKCGKWNFLDEKNIAPTEFYLRDELPPGPVCKKCMHPLDVTQGRWMSLNPGKSIIGYRIPQLMVPWIIGIKEQWMKLLWKRDNYPFGLFYNEVLGLSYDSASKPITRDELIECCGDYDLWDPNNLTQKIVQEGRKRLLTAGIDWGEGNDGSERSPTGKLRNASYTVLKIGDYINQRTWKLRLAKKYVGREIDPDFIINDIVRICKALDVKLVGADWGHGWGMNNQLVRRLGSKRVVQYQYMPKLRFRMKWDPIGYRYQLQRNLMISELFYDMKENHLLFPRWMQYEPYAKDILAIYAEYVEYRREIMYNHRPSDPDDGFHSLLYAKLTSDVLLGKSRRYTAKEVEY